MFIAWHFLADDLTDRNARAALLASVALIPAFGGIRGDVVMRAYAKLLVVFALAFGIAYAIRRLIAPGLVPIADSELPQWRFLTAFVLASIQNIALAGACLVMAVAAGDALRKLLRGHERLR
jgi:hypothetical protein